MVIKDFSFPKGKHINKQLSQVLLEDYQYLQYISSLPYNKPTQLNLTISNLVQYIDSELEKAKNDFVKIYEPIINCLNYFQIKRKLTNKSPSPFVDNMLLSLQGGKTFKGNIAETISYIAAKTKGRGNSKVHKEACLRFMTIFDEVNELQKITLENIKSNIKFE